MVLQKRINLVYSSIEEKVKLVKIWSKFSNRLPHVTLKDNYIHKNNSVDRVECLLSGSSDRGIIFDSHKNNSYIEIYGTNSHYLDLLEDDVKRYFKSYLTKYSKS